ncbi:UNVERIFIED_CONTAM: hypothetical protein Sindi_2880500 [Sesamum indicum]
MLTPPRSSIEFLRIKQEREAHRVCHGQRPSDAQVSDDRGPMWILLYGPYDSIVLATNLHRTALVPGSSYAVRIWVKGYATRFLRVRGSGAAQ